MALRREDVQRFDVSAFSALDLIRARVETERLETIPLNNVLTEQSLVDTSHADELGHSMMQKRGQITPIAVRAREEDSKVVYDVIDGFHRSAGKKSTGATDINATVIYGCSDEEMYDLRILAASSVRSVQFARIAEWITSSFATTDWAKTGLSVSQAFGMAVADSTRSNTVKLEPQEVSELKSWVKAKSERWGKTVGSTYQVLRIVANSDPELVREVRTASGGKARETTITQAKLEVVVNAYSGDGFHAAQRAILHHSIDKRLKIGEIEAIVKQLERTIKPGMTEDYVAELVQKVVVNKQIFPSQAEDNQDEISDTWEILDPSDDELLELEEEVDAQVNGIIPIKRARNEPKNSYKKANISTYARGETDEPAALRARISDLEQALEASKNNSAGAADTWWRTAQYLTPAERICMERLMYANEDLTVLSQEIKMPINQILLSIRSSFAKRHLLDPIKKPAI